jgi:hypothetical protein
MTPLAGVSRSTLLSLADGPESGRLAEPFDLVALRRHVPARDCGPVKEYLAGLAACGFTVVQAAMLLRAVADERADGQATADRVRLVWTGPETHASTAATRSSSCRSSSTVPSKASLSQGSPCIAAASCWVHWAGEWKHGPT